MQSIIKRLTQYFLVLLALSCVTTAAVAGVYNSNFSAAGSQGSSGYYYFSGHQATQTFAGTGLTSVDELTLTLNYGQNANYASQTLGLSFFLNGNAIGDTFYAPGDNSVHSLDFNFGSLTSLSGDWTLLMSVTTPVCSGCGAVQFSTNNPLALIDNGNAVPEPGSIALLGLGLAALCLRRRKS